MSSLTDAWKKPARGGTPNKLREPSTPRGINRDMVSDSEDAAAAAADKDPIDGGRRKAILLLRRIVSHSTEVANSPTTSHVSTPHSKQRWKKCAHARLMDCPSKLSPER
jgi:hypothetical protein